jgi:hypothetical protein
MINEATFEADNPVVTALPEQTRVAVEAAQIAAPEVGQVWRLTWAGIPPRLATVVYVADGYVHVVPLTLGLDQRVDAALIIDDTPLRLPLVAWPQLRTGIGDFALAECYGSFDTATTQALTEQSRQRATVDDLAAWNEGLTPEQVEVRRAYRDRLVADFAALCDSDWNLADLYDEPEEFLDSGAAVAAGLTLTDLADTAHMDLISAYPLWEGARPLPPGISDVLAQHFGADVRTAIRTLPTDRAARATIDSPEFRPEIVTVARRGDVPEEDTRRDLYRELVGAPGRETGAATERDYRAVLRMILDARLA